jgi:lysophospholipase L1-like esterase
LEKLTALLQVGEARRESAGHRRVNRRAGLCLAALSLASAAAVPAAVPREAWVGAWGFAPTSFTPTKVPSANPVPPPSDFDAVTVRQIVRVVQPAERLRIRISNEFGSAPLRLGAVHVALAGADGAALPGSDHAVTFSHQTGSVIPAGAPLLSDAIDWRVPRLARLAVSIYLPDKTPAPAHRVFEYVSAPGDFTGSELMPGATLVRSGALIAEVDVVSASAKRVVVALGDSITEGFGSTVNEFRSWPDRLAERLAENRATRDWSVVNAGINSNRLLHDGPGAGGLARFDRDVLSVPGVAAVILMEGINDIGYSTTVPPEAVTAGDIIAAYGQLVQRAHARGIVVFGATITPYDGAHYYSLLGEQMRRTVNDWIRSSGAFDGVIDFDAALRDPANPAQVNPALQRGDHLHPNDSGYAAMADAVDLRLFSHASGRH